MYAITDDEIVADLAMYRETVESRTSTPDMRMSAMKAIRAGEAELSRRTTARMGAVPNLAHTVVEGLDEYEKERGFRRD